MEEAIRFYIVVAIQVYMHLSCMEVVAISLALFADECCSIFPMMKYNSRMSGIESGFTFLPMIHIEHAVNLLINWCFRIVDPIRSAVKLDGLQLHCLGSQLCMLSSYYGLSLHL